MVREIEIRKEVELAATPEEVWAAIATGPGIGSWFMPHEIEPREGGVVRLAIGDFVAESTVTRWDPPHRFAARGEQGPDGSVQAFEYLIEGRDGGATVLRFIHSGTLGDDWGPEYESQAGAGWDMCLHTLGQYLTYFTRPAALFSTAEAAPADGAPADVAALWATLTRGLGLAADVPVGTEVRLVLGGLPVIDGVVDYVSRGEGARFLCVRAENALYRFHLRAGAVAVGHHLFTAGLDQKETDSAWQTWLASLFR
jgi:uncharacterized protein YndB with AHSA1/START domain